MAVVFPASPGVNDIAVDSATGATWRYDGTKWVPASWGEAFLPIAGGVMLGPLTLAGDASQALEPVSLQQLTAAVGAPTHVGPVAPSNPKAGDLWLNTSVNPPELMVWNGSNWVPSIGTQTGFLPLQGGQLSGPLIINTPSAGGALYLIAPGGVNASISWIIPGWRAWWAGVLASGHFIIADSSAGLGRLVIDMGGTVFVENRLSVGAGLDLTNFGSIAWAGSWSDNFNGSARTWWGFPVGQLMSLDGSANLTLFGTPWRPGGGAWVDTSDDRVKRDVIPYTSGLAAICGLEPIRFRFNGHGGTTDDNRNYYGLSAQATKSVMPELVHEMSELGVEKPDLLEGQLATDLTPLPLALVNAIKELVARVAALEAK